MIYLIGGAPRCGKTILSEKLSAKKKLSWISTDTLRVGLLAYLSKEEIEKKLPDQNRRLETHTAEELLESELTEAATLWPGVSAIVKHLIDSKQDYVIEGVHLMPEFVQQLKDTSYWSNIRLVYLVKNDIEEIKTGFGRNTAAHDWLPSALEEKNDDVIERAARMVQVKSVYIADGAGKFGFRVVDMGKDFTQTLADLSKTL